MLQGRRHAPHLQEEEVFYPGSEAFDALLGSPNGNAQAWILINHKAQLGVKTVSSIRIWTSSTIVAGQPNVFPDTEDGGVEAEARNMCYIYYDDPEEDGIFEDDGDGYWGLCEHMLFTFEDVSTSDEDAMDLS